MLDPLSRGRTRLTLDHPWLASLIFRLRVRPARAGDGVATMATDGADLIYDAEFAARLSVDEQAGVLAHESLHCGLLHHARRGWRDPRRWNIAADHAVNIILTDAGVSLPTGGLCDEQYRGLTAEQIYDRLPEDAGGSPDDLRDGESDPIAGHEWSHALASAMHAAYRAGVLPDGTERAITDALRARVDWRDALADHMRRVLGRDDYSYTRPSRRGRSLGMILPGMHSDRCGTVVVCVDTSGSMSAEDIRDAVSEIRSVLRSRLAESLFVIEADAAVHRTTEVAAGDDWSPTKMAGGGGTDFRPAIAAAEVYEPCIIVYISDLAGKFPAEADTDLLWITRSSQTAPLGRTLRMTGV